MQKLTQLLLVFIAYFSFPTAVFAQISPKTVPLSGILAVGEYGYLKSDQGEYFDPRFPNASDINLINNVLGPPKDLSFKCVFLKALGSTHIAESPSGFRIFRVKNILSAEEVPCD